LRFTLRSAVALQCLFLSSPIWPIKRLIDLLQELKNLAKYLIMNGLKIYKCWKKFFQKYVEIFMLQYVIELQVKSVSLAWWLYSFKSTRIQVVCIWGLRQHKWKLSSQLNKVSYQLYLDQKISWDSLKENYFPLKTFLLRSKQGCWSYL